MKSINDGPGQKHDLNRNNTGSKTANKEKLSTGKGATGPNWDKKSKGGEGDTGQNAGVFK